MKLHYWENHRRLATNVHMDGKWDTKRVKILDNALPHIAKWCFDKLPKEILQRQKYPSDGTDGRARYFLGGPPTTTTQQRWSINLEMRTTAEPTYAHYWYACLVWMFYFVYAKDFAEC